MKQVLWMAGLVLIVAGLGIRFVKQRAVAVHPTPPQDTVATAATTALPRSQCPAYTLDDNGVCVPVPRSVPLTTN